LISLGASSSCEESPGGGWSLSAAGWQAAGLGLRMRSVPRCEQHPTKSKRNPNYAKLGKIEPNPAKPGQRESRRLTLISLSESSLIKDLRGPPRVFFPLPRRLARMPGARRIVASVGSLAISHICIVKLRPLEGLAFLEFIMTQIQKICKEYVDKSPKHPEFRAFLRCARPSGASSPDRRPGGP
jgi:hypothetical protein